MLITIRNWTKSEVTKIPKQSEKPEKETSQKISRMPATGAHGGPLENV